MAKAKKAPAKKAAVKKAAPAKPKSKDQLVKEVTNLQRYTKGLKTKYKKDPKGPLSDPNNVLDTVIGKLGDILG